QLKKIHKHLKKDEIEMNYLMESNMTKKYLSYVMPNKETLFLEEGLEDLSLQAKKQREILTYFIVHPEPIIQKELLTKLKTTLSTLKQLVSKVLLRIKQH